MDKEYEKACCKICLLAANMKDCKACKFNHGLQEKDNTVLTQRDTFARFAAGYLKNIPNGVK